MKLGGQSYNSKTSWVGRVKTLISGTIVGAIWVVQGRIFLASSNQCSQLSDVLLEHGALSVPEWDNATNVYALGETGASCKCNIAIAMYLVNFERTLSPWAKLGRIPLPRSSGQAGS